MRQLSRKQIFTQALAVFMACVLLMTVITAAFLTVPALAVSQAEIDALKDKQSQLQGQQDELQGQIDELDTQKTSVLEQKAALDEQNELARQEIELIDQQLEIYDGLLENKAKELEAAQEKEASQTEAYRTRMRAMEENSTLTYLALLFDASNFSDFLTRLHDINDILEYDSELEKSFIEARQEVESVQAEFEAVKADQEAAQADMTAKKAALEKQIDDACQLIIDLENDIDRYEEEYAIIDAEEDEVNKELYDLIAQQERERAAAAAAAAAAAGTTTSTPSTATPGQAGFIWPTTTTYISSSYGWRVHPVSGVNKLHSGVDIGAGYGQPIYAAASGTVSVSTMSSGYGNYIMINHGNGLYTLYGHMSSRAVSAGQTVSQGQVIGYVGSTGVSTGPHLHFEVRVNGSTVDPMNYF